MFKNKIILLLTMVFIFSGCSDNSLKTIGLGRKKQDEFAIIPNPELSIPPSYYLTAPESRIVKKDIADNNLTEEEKKIINKLNHQE